MENKKTHIKLLEEIENYLIDNEKFCTTGVKAAGTRARKSLLTISKLCKERRQEILDEKTKC